MKYKFSSIRISVTKYDVTFATKSFYTPPPTSSPCAYVTAPTKLLQLFSARIPSFNIVEREQQ